MGQAWSTFLVPGLPSFSGGSWPMLAAAREGDHRHLVKYAQQEPLLLLACTLKGHSLAHMAAEAGRTSTLKLLVQLVQEKAGLLSARLQEVLNWSDSGAELLKNIKSKPQQEHLCQLLNPDLILQALLSWQDIKGVTPLMLAARGGHAECLALLLQHGANPLLLDSANRRSCLHYAAGAGHARCIHILLNEFVAVMQPAPSPAGQQEDQDGRRQQQQRLVLLPEAVMKDSIRGMTSFVDLRTRTGFSALHYATFWGFLGCVQALLTAGASVDLPMSNPSRQHSELPVVNGSTALHLAADYGHTAIAALLLHAHVARMARLHPQQADREPGDAEWLHWEGINGKDPRVHRNATGDTPLMLHENRCSPSSIMKVLLDAFAPINRTLPLVLDAVFGGPPRFGVPQLANLAKAALDSHLTGTLDQVEEEQQQQQQQQQQQTPCQLLPPDTDLARADSTDLMMSGPVDCGRLHSHSSSIDALADALDSAGVFGGYCSGGAACRSVSSSVGSTPAASRSTSYGSICSLAFGSLSSSSASSVVTGCSPGSTCGIPHVGSSSSVASCSKHSVSGHARSVSIDSTIAESVVSSASSTDHTCAICFDASANVMMAGCSHCMCTGCARSLLERTSASKPAVCPFCRAGLRGFVAAPLSAGLP